MQNSTLVWIIIAALIILGGGWYFLNNQGTPVPNNADEVGSDADNDRTGVGAGADVDVVVGGGGEESAAPMSASVTYGASGFAPSTVTVRVGGTVTWTNSGGGDMWVASAQHPTHTAYDGTTLQEHCNGTGSSFDQCANGSSYSFTFDKVGTWRYHNHSNSAHFGSVIVEE